MKQHQSNLTQLLKEMLVSKHPLVNKKLLFGWLESSLELTGLEKALRELNLVRDNMDRYSKERKAMTGMIEAKNTQILEFRDVVVSEVNMQMLILLLLLYFFKFFIIGR